MKWCSTLGVAVVSVGLLPVPVGAGCFAGEWVGIVDGGPGFRMHLSEDTGVPVPWPDVVLIEGWIEVEGDTLHVRQGWRAGADTLCLDVSPCDAPSPVGCDASFWGVLDGPDRVAGTYRRRNGRLPPEYFAWSASRVRVAVEGTTWGDMKQRYAFPWAEPN
jgi:hypothetical protein